MKKIQYKNKGFTLIELLIVLAIMGIIIQVIYSIFFVSNKSFNISKNKGFSQQDARLIAEVITKELRTAEKIEFDESKINGDYYTLELDKQTNSLIKKNKDKKKPPMTIAKGTIEKIVLNPSLEDIKGIVSVTLVTKVKNENYNLDFAILLENLPEFDQEISDDLNEFKIYYTRYE